MASEFERFKNEGNRLLKAGEIEMAVILYTSAAAAAESSRQAAIALGNRSLAQFRLENVLAAKADAEACIARDPSYEKGKARLRAADYEMQHGGTGGSAAPAAKPRGPLTDEQFGLPKPYLALRMVPGLRGQDQLERPVGQPT